MHNMFIVSPRLGLCNQLQSIVKALLFGEKYNRSVYIDQFQIDIDKGHLCDINEILDIDAMNQLYKEKNISIHILKKVDSSIMKKLKNMENMDNMDEYKLPDIDYTKLPELNCINEILDKKQQKEREILFLGNPVSMCINQSFNLNYNDFHNLYYFLMSNIIYQQSFHEIKNQIKTHLGLNSQQYSSIHLRIEDDALIHFSHCYHLTIDEYNKKLIDYYMNEINEITSQQTSPKTSQQTSPKIYVCSGILDYSNKVNSSFYKQLLAKNTNICDKRNIPIDSHIKNNRELIAIVDLLIAFDSIQFVGCWISSFSQLINSHFIQTHKKTSLFKL